MRRRRRRDAPPPELAEFSVWLAGRGGAERADEEYPDWVDEEYPDWVAARADWVAAHGGWPHPSWSIYRSDGTKKGAQLSAGIDEICWHRVARRARFDS